MEKQDKNKVKEVTFKKWAFCSDFEIKVENGMVVEALCKYCAKIDQKKLEHEARRRNLSGQVLKSILNYRTPVKYIHHKTLERHVGPKGSLHSWCKDELCGSDDSESSGFRGANNVRSASQKKVDEVIISSSKVYYEKLFSSVLFIVEEELAFRKLPNLMRHLMKNGVKFGTLDKINEIACGEMVDILAEVIMEKISEFFNEGKFTSLSGDGSEARKTGEEKELVYGKILVKGYLGFLPCTFLLACQSMKKFGGANANGTRKAMLDACNRYVPFECLKQMIVCLCADGASVNMGRHHGALLQIVEMLDWDAFIFHCFNHKLELSIKDSYEDNKSFTEIRDMLHTLHRLFKDSGRSWRIFQSVGESIGLKVLRYTKVSGTRFQPHLRRGLSNFLRNFLCAKLFAENVEEAGSGKDSLVTNKMYPKIVGFRKKWDQFGWLAVTNLFFRVLMETSQLSLHMESDSVLVYQLYEYVRDTLYNLDEISQDAGFELLPPNVEMVDEVPEDNSIFVKVSAMNVPLKKQFDEKHMNSMKENVHVVQERFSLGNVWQGNERVDNLRENFIPLIKDCISHRFEGLLEDEVMKALKMFDFNEWSVANEDSDKLVERDVKFLETLHAKFQVPLRKHGFSIIEAKKEWKRVKRIIVNRYQHLAEHQQMLWCRFMSTHGELFPNISLLLEIMLVLLVSSAVVERGFSAVRRNLGEHRLSMNNERLNSVLVIKINMPVLRKVIEDCENLIIKAAIEKYYDKKKWRWRLRPLVDHPKKEQEAEAIFGPPPKKIKRSHLDESDESEVESSENDLDTEMDDSGADSDDN